VSRKPEISSLTGLRFVAALTIALAHFGEGSGATVFGLPLNISCLGMPLFFALSGFIVHYVYAGLFVGGWRTALPKFALARFSRLYPLFFTLLLLYVAWRLGKLFYAHPGIGLSYATLTGSWWYWTVDGVSLAGGPYGDSWSISTEIFFYIVYALGLYRIARVRSIRHCAAAMAGFCLFAYVLLYGVWITANVWEPFVLSRHPQFISAGVDGTNSFYRWLIYVSPYFQILGFIAGCLTCQMFLLINRAEANVWRRAAEPLAWLGTAWILAALAMLYATWYFGYHNGFLDFINFLHMTFLMVPGCCLLILALALGGSSIGRALSHRIPVYLGEISYSIYLGHPFAIWLMFAVGLNHQPGYFLALGLLSTVIIATVLYFTIEVPAKAWLRNGFAALPQSAFVRYVNRRRTSHPPQKV
jgi:peptidoglycan/LPS O-acetylase OafA/YrhL